MKAIILLSGGLDSALVLALYLKQGWQCRALAFDYGQPHVIELEAAQRIAEHYRVPFEITALLNISISKTDDVIFAARNMIFASLGVAYAQACKFDCIAIGCNSSDWHRFPDCRPAFWTNMRTAAEDAYGVSIKTPLLHHTKIDVVQACREMGVPIELTWSCYQPIMDAEHGDHRPCGKCLACETRKNAECYSSSATS